MIPDAELLEGWLDGRLDEQGLSTLARQLDGDEAGEVLRHLETIALLRLTLQHVPAAQTAARVRGLVAARRPERHHATLAAMRRPRQRAWWPRIAGLSAVAALTLICVGAWAWWAGTAQTGAPRLINGSAHTVDGRHLRVGDHAPLGETLVADDPLTLRWDDASTVVLSRDGRQMIDTDGGILEQGRIDAEISPRKTHQPFIIRTTNAIVTVVGTRFSVRVDGQQTAVVVIEGHVRVRHRHGDERVLANGMQIVADENGWRSTADATSTTTPPPPITSSTHNTLTAQELADGWLLLFDGVSTAGWRGYRSASVPSTWAVRDGTLRLAPTKPGTSGEDLVSDREFRNFDLRFDWRITADGNGGVFYRLLTNGAHANETAPEFQLVGDLHPDARNALTRPAACYSLYPAEAGLAQAERVWNEARIVVRGHHVEHWLNGTLAVRYTLGSAEWLERVAASKFAHLPRHGRQPAGRIGLQDHGFTVAFRNLKIRPLAPTP